MEAQQRDANRWHFALGPVEKWAVTAIGAAFLYVGYWLVSSVQTVVTQQAVTNAQLTTISSQLTDVPVLRLQVAEQKLRADRLESDVKELRQTKGLR